MDVYNIVKEGTVGHSGYVFRFIVAIGGIGHLMASPASLNVARGVAGNNRLVFFRYGCGL